MSQLRHPIEVGRSVSDLSVSDSHQHRCPCARVRAPAHRGRAALLRHAARDYHQGDAACGTALQFNRQPACDRPRHRRHCGGRAFRRMGRTGPSHPFLKPDLRLLRSFRRHHHAGGSGRDLTFVHNRSSATHGTGAVPFKWIRDGAGSAASVSVEHLSRKFATRGRRQKAPEEIDPQIAPGEFFVIVGPSGCGKTMLLRILQGLIRPSSGQSRRYRRTRGDGASNGSHLRLSEGRARPLAHSLRNVVFNL